MFYIPGEVISAVTFPGVAVHELAHQIGCRISKIPVYEVKYFRFGNPAGYVVHEPSQSPWKNLLVVVGPFLVNSILGMVITVPAYCIFKNWMELGNHHSNILFIFSLFLLWIGVSIMMHAFPSTGDAKSLVESVMKNPEVNILVKLICAPIIGIIYIGAIGSVVWLDLIYAVAIMEIIPRFIMRYFF